MRGYRYVDVSFELLAQLVRADITTECVEAVNVPADLEVMGIGFGGAIGGCATLRCESAEWDEEHNGDRFIVLHRRKEAS